MIRIVFTINNQQISEEHQKKMQVYGLEWQIINDSEFRVLIGAIVMHVERAESLRRFLTAMGYEPVMIYYLDQDGIHTGDIPFAENEYINAMPDIVQYDKGGNETSRERPTVFEEIHIFNGWGTMNV